MIYPEIVGRSGKGVNYLGRPFGLLSKKSILEGKQIVRDNRSLLRHIESAYGVEKEVLVAILRLETNFGRVKGNVPIFNSLLTLSLIENRRSAWAEEELAYLLLMCRNSPKGSTGDSGFLGRGLRPPPVCTFLLCKIWSGRGWGREGRS